MNECRASNTGSSVTLGVGIFNVGSSFATTGFSLLASYDGFYYVLGILFRAYEWIDFYYYILDLKKLDCRDRIV